ncbi:hypothetical protein [Spongiimicrobium sp. 3-5]|uniref:hypothetical protein n=1 Tax=Spongiimicrobium sp. 3-5 TaxID=3332596 RepID=UPI0039809376
MAERLVVLSDMWGVKKGLWITSYLGYLQQHYDIVFYDCQQLAHIDLAVNSTENLREAFLNGGMDTAVAHLLIKETGPSHYLAFCGGGTIVWKAALKGLPIKSLFAISPANLYSEQDKPDCPVKILCGENQEDRPSLEWSKELKVPMEIMPNYGRELYSDEKIITKVCQDLLDRVIQKQEVR